MPGWRRSRPRRVRRAVDGCWHGRQGVSRFLLVLLVLAATAGAVIAYKDPEQVARATDTVSDMLRKRAPTRGVQIARGQGGEFALKARINGITAPMVIDTGATSVVLTYEP